MGDYLGSDVFRFVKCLVAGTGLRKLVPIRGKWVWEEATVLGFILFFILHDFHVNAAYRF